MITLTVDKKEIQVEEGSPLLKACLDHGIYVPNLCYVETLEAPPVSCRLCFVEIEGEREPVTSCNIQVSDGMVVHTDTPSVRRLQRTAFQLLMSVHRVDCAHCPANKRCELQRIARFLKIGLKPGPLIQTLKEPDILEDHPVFDYYPNRCVLCGRCIHACQVQRVLPLMSFAERGFETVIRFYNEADLTDVPCTECLACVSTCPVGAIALKGGSGLS